LVLLIPARDQHQELCRDAVKPSGPGIVLGLQARFRGGLPGGFDGGRIGRRQLQQALVKLRLRLGQGGEGIDAQEQGARFVLVMP
jgi:hypothetical protein